MKVTIKNRGRTPDPAITKVTEIAGVHRNTASAMVRMYRDDQDFSIKPTCAEPILLKPNLDMNSFTITTGKPLKGKKGRIRGTLKTKYKYRVTCHRCKRVSLVPISVIMGRQQRKCCEREEISEESHEIKQHEKRMRKFSAYRARNEGVCWKQGRCGHLRHCSDLLYETECIGHIDRDSSNVLENRQVGKAYNIRVDPSSGLFS